MKVSKKNATVITFILILCLIIFFIINKYGLTHLYIIFQRITNRIFS